MSGAAPFSTGAGGPGHPRYKINPRVPYLATSDTSEACVGCTVQCSSEIQTRLQYACDCESNARCCSKHKVSCHAPSLRQVCALSCVKHHVAQPEKESICHGVKTSSCCCHCCFHRAARFKESDTVQGPRGLFSRLAETCRGTKIIWRKVLYMIYRLRQVRHKVCAKMGHLDELRHRLRRVKKVLYVCEGMSNSMGEAMAARDRTTRYNSVQQDTTLGFPHQVQRPDGEERYPSKRPFPTQDPEIQREFIKPPANKTLSDVNVNGPHHSFSGGGFMAQPEWGPFYGYPAPFDAQSPHSAVSASSSSSSSSSLSSSSLQAWGGREEGQTCRSSRNPLGRSFSPFAPSRFDRSPQTLHQESNRRRHRHQGHFGANPPSPSHDLNVHIPSCPTTLEETTVVPVLCGPSAHSLIHQGPSEPQGINMGSLGAQGDLSHTYGQSSQLPCSPTAEPQHPPLYSDVIENNSLYRSGSRPSEQRTKSGKI